MSRGILIISFLSHLQARYRYYFSVVGGGVNWFNSVCDNAQAGKTLHSLEFLL